ncbi:hypothetical protein J1N10_15920 [Carboxylicivirga sp. A043]|uniref:hypothetical protein n=1 Tax=Carboxylicivirga litoralis TaxID=2816963 RepID=UPI0021CB7D27|nr:hypothetical protein [Carboxylicivirga sp. A043]MCU4157465.1 hypothetical protein [Carboxylicivirga sp. A043]
MKKLSIVLLASLLFLSCQSDEEQLIGIWDDNIHLSTKSVELGAQASSATITTKGEWWWIDAIKINEQIYQYYNSEEVNMEKGSYKIVEEAFTFERKNNTTMIISLPENTSGKTIKMDITLEAGNYFDYVSITQVAQ